MPIDAFIAAVRCRRVVGDRWRVIVVSRGAPRGARRRKSSPTPLRPPRNSAGPGSAGCRSAALSSSYGTKRSAWAWSRADSAAARSVAPNFMARGGDQRALRGELVTISQVLVAARRRHLARSYPHHLAPDRAGVGGGGAAILATRIGTPDSYWNLRTKKSLERGQRRRLAARERTCYECTSARGSRADAGRRRRPAAMNVPPGLGGQDRCAA